MNAVINKTGPKVSKVKKSSDRQLTGMAGEFLVVGQLFKRGLQASVTDGNAKAIDVLVYNPTTKRTFSVSVKTLRERNWFSMWPTDVCRDHTYVFVLLHEPGEAEQFFIVPGADIFKAKPHFFGVSINYKHRPGISCGPLKPYEDNWKIFNSPNRGRLDSCV